MEVSDAIIEANSVLFDHRNNSNADQSHADDATGESRDDVFFKNICSLIDTKLDEHKKILINSIVTEIHSLTDYFESLKSDIEEQLTENRCAIAKQSFELNNCQENMNKYYDEINTLKSDFATFKEVSCNKIKILEQKIEKDANLSDEINGLKKVIRNQQIYLEKLDAAERRHNLVITGLSEEISLLGYDSDIEKTIHLFEVIGVHGVSYNDITLKRIGKAGRNTIQPILIICKSELLKQSILKKAKKLKTSGTVYEKIFIKRDSHPVVRAEWSRLFKSFEDAKNNCDNIGNAIVFDYRKRTIFCNGMPIDTWKAFF